MITIQELREEASRTINTRMKLILSNAADTIEELARLNDGTIRVAADALKRVRELEYHQAQGKLQ